MSTNKPIPQERLDAIRKRVDGATRGPWDCYGDYVYEVFDAGEWVDGDLGGVVVPAVTKLSDAEFIAHARTDIPVLLAEVERLRARPTVDDAMVERAMRAAESAEPHTVLTDKGPRIEVFSKKDKFRAALDAALGTEEEA